ncbi:DUF2793 domain-containing protein [Xinfangfangia sp. D13-10-4-6]|uniref:DUF2793 domain-containing protein n=1 Tax=Pseudogemmobacter hezensis TaxID=2737662 RepID=UPI001553697C|nr:DUF2793 domain-containing protein [Pseudogemmobacter hezensis]NPD14041.1 DUF2793 domain-containing protein [Pseudogemmobacter hezensis]
MSDTTDILALPLILPAQAQKHVTHNEALLALDAIVQLAVLDRDRTAPPETASPGDRHLVAGAGAGLWAGQGGQIAVLAGTGWQFHAAQPGWQAYVLAEGQLAVFDGLAWKTPDQGEAGFQRLGISTPPDSVNRLAVASEAVLLTHQGAGMQLKLNKAAPADTASLLFQTNWSGRAEMGTTGGSDFAIRVSADGATWATGLQIAASSGAVNAAQNLTLAGAQVFSRGNILGAVAQAGGQPTGAVIERGSGANGEYIRLADGTQICWRSGLSAANVSTALGAGFTSAAVAWTFPQPFVAGSAPVVSGMADGVDCWLSQAAPSVTAVSLRVLGLVSKAAAVPIRVMAVGRWF